MNKIKADFVHLSNELISHFGEEMLKKIISEMGSKAQVSVDIVVRNLFERTADIGFLATDEAIRNFLRKNPTIYSENYQVNLKVMQKRFEEYAPSQEVLSILNITKIQESLVAPNLSYMNKR